MLAQPEIQLRIPPAQVGIKGDAQLRFIDPRKGQPVIGDEHPRLGAVALLEPPDLLPDLAEAAVRQLPRQKGTASSARMVTRRLYTTPSYFFFSSTNTRPSSPGTP